MNELDGDLPEPSTTADVTLVARGVTVTANVEESGVSALVLRPTVDTLADVTTVKDGDAVEVYWVRGEEERMLSAAVSRVEVGSGPRWHLQVKGPSERSQRRRTVRAQVELSVRIPWAGGAMVGQTIDLSESGTRVVVDGWGLPPEPGNPVSVHLALDDGDLDLPAEVVWQRMRGAQWMIAVRFTALPERVEDRLRRRVFQILREERAAANA